MNLGVSFKARYGKKIVFVALVTIEKNEFSCRYATEIVPNAVRAINYTAKIS
jgi:hypothetical protein